jgi:hypothetical protein
LLTAALEATQGVSWGERFQVIVDALEDSGCAELLDVLHAAAQFDDRAAYRRAWVEIDQAVGEDGAGLVALDLVVEIGQRQQARATGVREWWRGDDALPRFAGLRRQNGVRVPKGVPESAILSRDERAAEALLHRSPLQVRARPTS